MFLNDVADLDADLLVAYIQGNHHAFVRRAVAVSVPIVREVARTHGPGHPKLHEVARRFEGLVARTIDQMTREEQVLFPYISDAAAAFRSGNRLPRSPYRAIEDPLRQMKEEHAWARQAMNGIWALAGGYVVPDGACERYIECMRELEAFDRDLAAHADAEENTLAPKLRALFAPVFT